MKIKNLSIVGISALAIAMSACPAATNTNTANSNANKNAVVTNVNTTNNASANTNANTTNTATSNAATTTTDGQVIKIEEAGITVTVPKGFKFSKDGEDTVIKSEDEGVDVRFTVPKDGDYAKTVSDAAKEIDSYLDDVKIEDKGSKVDVSGMEGTSMSGTAKNEGEDVMWDLTIINAPKKPVLANIYAEKASMAKYGAQVKELIKSIKKQ
ncbi:MAG TPA: hypothetical protein VGC76_03300 [Pyrinomonadaceae bacterium]|jgi:hypothetical protein